MAPTNLSVTFETQKKCSGSLLWLAAKPSRFLYQPNHLQVRSLKMINGKHSSDIEINQQSITVILFIITGSAMIHPQTMWTHPRKEVKEKNFFKLKNLYIKWYKK
jgi:hypothetical protein